MSTQISRATRYPYFLHRLAQSLTSLPRVLAGLALAALLAASTAAFAATAPPLGSTSTYGVVSTTFTNANTAPQTIINGTATLPAVCYTTAPVTPPLSISGTTIDSPFGAAVTISSAAVFQI